MITEADRLRSRITELEEELRRIIEIHHITLAPSKLHDPENQGIDACPAKTCSRTREILAKKVES